MWVSASEVPCAPAAPFSGDAFINPGSTDSRETKSLMEPTLIAMMHASSLACDLILRTPHLECRSAAVWPWHGEQLWWCAGGECGVVYNKRQRMPQQPGWDSPTLNTNASGANLRLYYSFEYGEHVPASGPQEETVAAQQAVYWNM